MKELSTYLGSDEYSDRIAKVLWDDKDRRFYVDMKMEGFSELRVMESHGEKYAEDCAENFVRGYGEFSRGFWVVDPSSINNEKDISR